MTELREVDVIGVRVEVPSNSPIVLLKEVEGSRYLPIWIGAVEATAIAFAQQGIAPPRPMTHDLLKDVITALGATVAEIRITALVEGTYYAEVVFSDGTAVSARPSDAIALGIRVGTKVRCAAEVLDDAGIEIADEQEAEVEEFREFLDHVTPEDFGAPPADEGPQD